FARAQPQHRPIVEAGQVDDVAGGGAVPYPSRRWQVGAIDALDDGRLAGAARADQRQAAALVEPEGDVTAADDSPAAQPVQREHLAQTVDLEQRPHSSDPTSSCV